MKESRPFLNILVLPWTNRARTILYFIRYQKGLTSNEKGSHSATELLFLRIYLSLVRPRPPSSPPTFRSPLLSLSPLLSFSLAFLSHSVSPNALTNPSHVLSLFRGHKRAGGGRRGKGCKNPALLYLDETTGRVTPRSL